LSRTLMLMILLISFHAKKHKEQSRKALRAYLLGAFA